jgi:hypothetical protein
MNGHGVLHRADGYVYEGNWSNGEESGDGEAEYPNGAVFKGVFVHGGIGSSGELNS